MSGFVRMQPTHFIEQYVGIESWKVNNTTAIRISSLERALAYTAEMPTLKTIAIFKIKYKKP